jgi:alpha-L-fucosidase
VEHYFTSVGRNTNLLIGMVIDNRGLIPEADQRRFAEFGDRIKKIFSKRLAVAEGTGNTISLPLPKGGAPNMLMLMEDIAHGERVRKFVVEGLINDEWIKVWGGTCIGHKKIERFDPINASELRLTVTESVAEPQIREFSAWAVEDGLAAGSPT